MMGVLSWLYQKGTDCEQHSCTCSPAQDIHAPLDKVGIHNDWMLDRTRTVEIDWGI